MPSTASQGTLMRWLTPENRALNSTLSAPIEKFCVAEAEMFSTIRPSFTNWRGTSTPSRVASTIRCGVQSQSTIHSSIARSRYGRRDSSGNAHLPLLRRQAQAERRTREQQVGVFEQRREVLRHVDAIARQPPEDGRHGHIDQRQFIA